ncbi:hypothetical protein [Paenibacillus terrae]|uniref:Uncharacterized protein n=1 Tax=Paenibacillus terrae TaxID=159743 RepID=A0A0D7WXT6_9BACL|nr:hypothetical protein [Paenibacillus terrae]KJD42557.1 hypothetical protein QD47_27640 [Paenibacillus terrae]
MNIAWIRFEYFNGCQNVYIGVVGGDEYLNSLIPKFENTISVEEGETIHWGENEHGVVNFGLWNDNPDKRPGHGGMWSSRAGVVGPLIDRKMVDVGINGIATHITVEALEKLLPDDYEIRERDSYGETVYEVHRKDGNNTPSSCVTQLHAGYWYGVRPDEG